MIPQLGDLVRIPSIDSVGIVSNVDHANLFTPHKDREKTNPFPIQVDLDTPHSRCLYDSTPTYRTNLKDIEIIERKAI